jgi:hypothetical protein
MQWFLPNALKIQYPPVWTLMTCLLISFMEYRMDQLEKDAPAIYLAILKQHL